MKRDELETDRLWLRMWRESDLDDYAEMSADPAVMQYLTPASWLPARIRGAASRFSWGTGRCAGMGTGQSRKKRPAA